jgi:flagellar basal body-associated protein FliL
MPPRKRLILIAVSVVLVLCVGRTIWFFATFLEFRPKAMAPDTPAWRTAYDVTSKIIAADESFVDVQVVVETESPMQLRIEGEVHSDDALKHLQSLIHEQLPDAGVTWAVDVRKR